jgi:isoquinoline 1-oxidoreductase subunit alpha
MAMTLNINGVSHSVDIEPETPLLWVLRDAIGLTGTKYGCGISRCGACTVHVDGQPVKSCQTAVSAAVGKQVTTIEGLSKDNNHPVQQAWREVGRSPVRLLPVWPDHVRCGAVAEVAEAD